jgi:hypothetical protein
MIPAIIAAVAPSLFRLLEAKFGPKTGDVKMQTAVEVAQVIMGKLATAGKLGSAAPAADELKSILETLLSQEKAKPDWKEQGVVSMKGRKFVVEIVDEVA